MKKISLSKIILISLLSLPTFWLMLKFGVYTMHDFHIFRQFEFDKCIQSGIFPCRWAPDAGMGYGEPLFNFYGQLPYWFGEIFHLAGFSIIDSVKILFILSIVLSGIGMYFVSRKYWGEWGGILSAVLYMYAPYRAVDVWVRGALNESLAFVLFPLIFYHLDEYLDHKSAKNLIWLSLAGASLLITHNLSVLMFAPFLLLWWLIKSRKITVGLMVAAILTTVLAAFYLVPVIFESSLVTVSKTTQGYYDYRAHFTTLNQLLVSRFWGYGASLWGPVDDMSFSIGQAQWAILGVTIIFALLRRKIDRTFLVLAGLAGLAFFLTHGRSQFIWNLLPPFQYVQFPWRFLGLGAFFLSLAAGMLAKISSKWIVAAAMLAVIVTNYQFFTYDIWRPISDSEQFSGQLWDEQRSSALQDFWPKSAPEMPVTFAPPMPESVGPQTQQIPVVYFPGWEVLVNNNPVEIKPEGKLGLITFDAGDGGVISTKFTDTWPRTAGNIISIIGVGIVALWAYKVYSRN
jgi:hypothetical protein